MADGHFATLVSRTRDANAATNPIYTQLTDGTNLITSDGSGNLNVILAANSGVDIGDVDVTSVIPGTGATNLGKAIDSVGGATDTGVAALVIRDDALTTLTPADGDYVALRVNSTGALWVTFDSSSFPSKIDDSAFGIATDSVSPSGFLADETAPDSVDEGDVGLARMTLDRKQLFVLTDATTDSQRLGIDASGNAQVILAANSGVDIGDVDVTSVIPGVGATNLGKAVDSAAGATDTGVAGLFVRDDALTTLTPVDGDYVTGRTTSTGAIWTSDVKLAANTALAPLFVQVVNTATASDEVQDYQTTASVAADGTTNHDYTVTGATLLVKSVIWSSSGGSKLELQTGPVAGLTTDAVGFIPKEGGVQQLFFDPPIEVPVASTGTARRNGSSYFDEPTGRTAGLVFDTYWKRCSLKICRGVGFTRPHPPATMGGLNGRLGYKWEGSREKNRRGDSSNKR
jgi:hypothetical protein